jgi:hypothetical protein
MKKAILALAELYIDFELFESINLNKTEIRLAGEMNYKTAKEVLRLNMHLKTKKDLSPTAESGGIFLYVFEYKKPHTPNIIVSLVEAKTTNEDTILEKLKQQFELI